MNRTTPPRPFDVAAVFPRLAPLARTAIRLHPRPGKPSPHDSSVGGPLLWPADEPWPYCERSHTWDGVNTVLSPEDVRLWRRHQADAARRRDRDGGPWATPEELAAEERIMAGRPWPESPIAMVPVAQLYARDMPGWRPPGQVGADLLQVLWCPFDHPSHPRTAVFVRSSATVKEVLGVRPEPPAVQFPTYLPEPCALAPEKVTEYPHFLELGKELQEELNDWSRWQPAGPALDPSYEVAPEELYMDELSVAPGWKAGGWTRWGLTDPAPRLCPACGTEAEPLLTIATTEWNGGSESWQPQEDRLHPVPLPPGTPPANFTMIDVARGYDLQLHACPAAPDHPHIELVQ